MSWHLEPARVEGMGVEHPPSFSWYDNAEDKKAWVEAPLYDVLPEPAP